MSKLPVPPSNIHRINVPVEAFKAFIELYGGRVYGEPDYYGCNVRAFIKFEGPKGEVEVSFDLAGLDQKPDGFYYARAEAWTHVRVQGQPDIHVKGKGARSWYEGTYESVSSRVWAELLEMTYVDEKVSPIVFSTFGLKS